MADAARVFVPHRHCTVSSGDCFALARCLGQCKKMQKLDHESRIRELERRLLLVESATLPGKARKEDA